MDKNIPEKFIKIKNEVNHNLNEWYSSLGFINNSICLNLFDKEDYFSEFSIDENMLIHIDEDVGPIMTPQQVNVLNIAINTLRQNNWGE